MEKAIKQFLAVMGTDPDRIPTKLTLIDDEDIVVIHVTLNGRHYTYHYDKHTGALILVGYPVSH